MPSGAGRCLATLRSALVFRAVVRGAAEHHRPAQRASAARTALPFFAMMKERARREVSRDGGAEDAAHGGVDRARIRIAEAVHGAARMNVGLEENLVGVEVAQ